jgi:FkbM family methyltransferase
MHLWSRADDWISNQVYWRGWAGYEPEMSPLFFRLATSARVVLDVGAHIGFYTLLAAHANPDGVVFAFEPHPRAYGRLERNVTLNALKNVRCVPEACGAVDAVAQLHSVDTEGIASGSTLNRGFMRPEWGLCSWPVNVAAVDPFVARTGIECVDLVKLDTEGTEADVLIGMLETLRQCKPAIFCEVLPDRNTEAPLMRILEERGYCYYLLTASGPTRMDRIRAHPTWFNWLFSPLASEDIEHPWQGDGSPLRAKAGR